jgi:hypothetical protein
VRTGKVDTYTLGSYMLGFYLTDPSGNAAIPVFRQVTIQDTTRPVVSLLGSSSLKVQVNYPVNDPGLKIKDNLDTKFRIDTSGSFYYTYPDGIPTHLGKYTINYAVSDLSGNTTIVSREVLVMDTMRPQIHLIGFPVADICRWKVYSDSGYVLSDNYYPDSMIKVTIEGDFDGTDMKGFRILRYRAEDSSHNVSHSEWRYINILPETDPACVSGIRPGSAQHILVYPNPTGDGTLQLISSSIINTITVYDLAGQILYHRADVGEPSVQLMLRSLPSGLYLLDISTRSGLIHSRFVISR